MDSPKENKNLLRALNQILAAGNLVNAIPVDIKLCQFLYTAMKSIDGVESCTVCLYSLPEPFGDKIDNGCTNCNFFDNHSQCNKQQYEDNSIYIFPLSTFTAKYAYIALKVNNDFAHELIAALQNLANISAITIENSLQRMELQEKNKELQIHRDHLEKKVLERTNELEVQNKELKLAKEKAEESDRLKTAFLHNMSHEIRTPMNAIMGFAELISQNIDDKDKLINFSEIINQRCNDLLDIINDLLDFAKIESGQLPVRIEECNITDLFSELRNFFSEQKIKLNKPHIYFDLKEPRKFNNFTITTDKVKLKQIFINLISNAFKFTEAGKIEGGYKLDENQKMIFYVSDTGIGIPQDKHQYIFERFTQVEQNNKRFLGGTGLGLPIVKGLTELLGGKVWLKSESGKGSTFYFTIGYNTLHNPDSKIIQADKNQINYHFNNKIILVVVEDDPFNSALIKEILSVYDLKLLYAETGSEAIKKAGESSPDLVLMDIGLPDMFGFEATRQILNQKPGTKIIAQTAYATPEDKDDALNSGCIDFISKPLKAQKLLSLINNYLL
jgi:signal transduction histidine kinase/CheY-like chemotaxis protein